MPLIITPDKTEVNALEITNLDQRVTVLEEEKANFQDQIDALDL